MNSFRLQHWLQLTYELESLTFAAKRRAAEEQLELAKDMCEKLKKKRSSLVGAFVSTHGRNIDDVDRSILEAKTALIEVTKDLSERSQRWRQIEMLCGCSIISNPGLTSLKNLVRHVGAGRHYGIAGSIAGPGSVRSSAGMGSRMSASASHDDLVNDPDFDAHSVAPSHLSSHLSRPASLFSTSTTATAAHISARTRRGELKSISRESSKESSSSDELDRASNFTSSSENHAAAAAAVLGGAKVPTSVSSSSPAASKRAKMMVKSYSQDASGSIGSAANSNSTAAAGSVVSQPGSIASAAASVAMNHAITTSASEGQLQQAKRHHASSNSPSLSSSRSGSSVSQLASSSSAAPSVSVTAASGIKSDGAGGTRPSVVEEMDESCSASDSGSVTDVSGKKKKKSFFHFKRKKEKKVEM